MMKCGRVFNGDRGVEFEDEHEHEYEYEPGK